MVPEWTRRCSVIVHRLAKIGLKALPLVVGMRLAAAQNAELLAPLIEKLRADLRSDDPIRFASAGREAAELHVEALAPEIVTALERAPARDLGPLDPKELDDPHPDVGFPAPQDPRFDDARFLHRFVPGALLDSLTQLEVAAPDPFIERTLLWTIATRLDPADPFPYFKGAWLPALVVFAQHGSEYQDLIERIMELTATRRLAPNDLRAWVAADWCATFEPKRLVQTMIDLPTWSVVIDVYGNDHRFGRCGGAWAWFGRPAWPRQFPGEIVNVVDGSLKVGAKCLFDQPVPLFWRRGDPTVIDLDPHPRWDEPDDPVNRPRGDVAVAFLRGAGNLNPAFAATSTEQTFDHDWKGADELLEFARKQRPPIEAEWGAILQALVKRGLIDAATAARKPATIRFEFNDHRYDKRRVTEPLPSPPR